MKRYLNAFSGKIDCDFLRRHTRALMECELPQTTPATHKAADYAYKLLKDNGFDAQRLNFVSDGRTEHMDKIMPLCWDVSFGRLTVMSDWDGDEVIADYEKEPFSLVRFSTATPVGGLSARLVTWAQMQSGVSAKGAFVSLPQGLFPTDKAVVPALDAGAVGIITGTVAAPEYEGDSVHWANNFSETNSWYVNEGERPFVGFSVSPNTLKKLESAAEKGTVMLKAETDGRRYVGEMPAVTALVRGERDREFWVLAHTGEPLEDDNSAGVISSVHSLISIRNAVNSGEIPSLKYSVRVIFAPALYGFAAFADSFGVPLHNKCIGAICVDGMPICPEHDAVNLQFATADIPFFGNVLLEAIWDEYNRTVMKPPFVTSWWDHLGDDCFMCDRSVGLPTVMPEYAVRLYWHNSHQRYGYVDYEKFARVCAVYTAFIASVAAYDSDALTRVLPRAAVYAERRLAQAAESAPPRPGTDENERMRYLTEIELSKLRAFADAGVSAESIDTACRTVEEFAASLIPLKAAVKQDTPVFDSLASVVPLRTSVGVPHDFARMPLERRHRPFILNLMGRIFSAMDGKKSLARLITEAEWEERTAWSEAELADFMHTLKLMDEFGYIKLL